MSQCSPAQYALPHDPALRTEVGKALTFTISLYARNGAIVLKMDQDGQEAQDYIAITEDTICLLYTSPSPRDQRGSRMPSSA